MATKSGPPRRAPGRARNEEDRTRETVVRENRSESRRHVRSNGPLGEAEPRGKLQEGECPLCGNRKLDVTPKPPGSDPPCHVGCWSCCPPDSSREQRREFIRDLAAEVGALDRNGKPSGWVLLDDPHAYLADRFDRPARRVVSADRVPPPTIASAEAWSKRLFSEGGRRGLRYLRKRGLTDEAIRAAKVGWDGKRLTFPMFQGGELVAFKTRFARDGAPMMNLKGSGRAWPLYPEPEPGRTLLLEGELDALRARSEGLPATSVTLGAGTWRDEWTDALRGRLVVVCFDVGAEAAARRAVRRLRKAGVRARRLNLREFGLTEKNSDLSDYLDGGGSAAELRRELRRRRPTRKEAA